MLRIKDEVDLKELEKFGFLKDQSIDDGEYYYRICNTFSICNIFIGNNKIILQDDGINCCRPKLELEFDECEIDILYDLIKANLVEKVNWNR